MINLPVNYKKKEISHRNPKTMSAKTNPDIESVQRCVSCVTEFFLIVQKKKKKKQQRLIICVKTV